MDHFSSYIYVADLFVIICFKSTWIMQVSLRKLCYFYHFLEHTMQFIFYKQRTITKYWESKKENVVKVIDLFLACSLYVT